MSPLQLAFLVTFVLLAAPGLSQVNADCLVDLTVADGDGDLLLTSTEYVSFVSLQSDGRLEFSGFSEMPLSLVSPYHFGACACSLTSTDDQCCVGDNARIDLDQTTSTTNEDILISFCRAVEKAISSLLPTTSAPTPAPESTSAPLPVPSSAPASVPSSAPASVPSAAPARVPSAAPARIPSAAPARVPSSAPIPITTPAPVVTPRPTAQNELCIIIQFGIVNNVGLDADDILKMSGNTLKTGLIIATENITIQSLNAGFPNERSLRYRNEKASMNADVIQSLNIVPLDDSNSKFQDDLALNGGVLNKDRQLVAHVGSKSRGDIMSTSRRLAFYSKSLPPVILSIIDNSFCPSTTPDVTRCQIVSVKTCVFLEEGDDRELIRDELSKGFQASVTSGEFEAAIPEEHRLE